jgi:hypothetical protein
MRNLQLNCPSCAAKITFHSSISVYLACAFCGTTVVRHDLDLEIMGKVAILDESWSPIQIGVTGTYFDLRFSVIGRLRRKWADGSWNEWFLLFSDGTDGWLADAQGFYFVSRPVANDAVQFERAKKPLDSDDPKDLEVGHNVIIDGIDYKVVDRKEATVTFCEGELPFPAPIGTSSLTIDLGTSTNNFATLEFLPTGGVHQNRSTRTPGSEANRRQSPDYSLSCYTGHILEFYDFSFSGLREIDGWKIPSTLS